jgi:hypothetical protein
VSASVSMPVVMSLPVLGHLIITALKIAAPQQAVRHTGCRT